MRGRVTRARYEDGVGEVRGRPFERPEGKGWMWVVADLDDDYIAQMEDVLKLYERPYDPETSYA